MSKGRKGCMIFLGILGVAILCAVPWLVQVTKVYADAQKAGFLEDVQTDKYKVGRENNLKAIHKALMQAADSEGSFPQGKNWMDAALLRLKTSDITEDEAKDKLRVPMSNRPVGSFGYAFNDAFSGKSPDQIRVTKDAILVFESEVTTWNANGDPLNIGKKGGKGVTLDGTIVNLATH